MKTSKQRIRDALNGVSEDNLTKIYAILFDIWCWDSGNENLKEIVDVLQSRIDGNEHDILIDKQQTSSITHSSNGLTTELFKFNWGSLELGYDLELALENFIRDKLFISFNGVALSTLLENLINDRIMTSCTISSLTSDINTLRYEIEELKKKVDT